MGLSILALAVSAVYARPTAPFSASKKAVVETEGVTTGSFFKGDLFTLIVGKCDGVCTLGHCDCSNPPPTPPSNDCPPVPGVRTNVCDVGAVGALCRRDAQCNVCTGGDVGELGCTTNLSCDRSCIEGRVGDQCGGATSEAAADALCNIWSSILSTDFESAADGWDLGHSVCGDEFAYGVTCNYPVTNACITKDHVGNQNCCPDDPNEVNGWSMSPSGAHCRYPGINNVNPSQLKSASTQHMRFQKDPLGGNPAGCTALCNGDGNCAGGGGSACRQRYITSQAAVGQVSRSVWKEDIAWSGQLGTSMDVLYGEDTHAGSIFTTARVYWGRTGYLWVNDAVNGGVFRFLGYWRDTIPNYAQFTIDFNPCENEITYSYDNGRCDGCFDDAGTPDPLDDSCSAANCALVPPGPACCGGGAQGSLCTVNADCNLSITMQYGFTPPYGDLNGVDARPPTTDTSFASTDHFNTVIDIDNYFVTNTPCTEACCDQVTEECVDVEPGTCASKISYPNTKCAALGTPGYPPACALPTGSCCDSGPRAGGDGSEGSCTNGVLEADCQGVQLTWVKGGSCTDVAGACHIGLGICGAAGCQNFPIVGKKCTVNADCNIAGFCWAGTCTPASVPGHCEYPSGYCASPTRVPPAEMGQCQNGPDCVPSTGAGCCDPGCPTPCPGVTGPCVVDKQICHDIPQGSDCAFCEGCTAQAASPCTVIGAVCAPQFPGLEPGVCVANPSVACNINSDCPSDTPVRTCVLNKGSKHGQLCVANSDCDIEASACLENTGACCNYVKGTCRDNVLDADCKDAQDEWTKLGLCADIEAAGGCDPHLGACCDEDTFGGCEQTTENACAALKKGVFYKLQDCADIVCVHKAIPTVSEWGIAVLTLLLLIGAKVYFGRRQAATA